jgi:hypothetical protein
MIVESADWLTLAAVGEVALMLKSGVDADGDEICDE